MKKQLTEVEKKETIEESPMIKNVYNILTYNSI